MLCVKDRTAEYVYNTCGGNYCTRTKYCYCGYTNPDETPCMYECGTEKYYCTLDCSYYNYYCPSGWSDYSGSGSSLKCYKAIDD